MKTLLITFLIIVAQSASAQPWYQIPVPVHHKLNAIDFPSATVGYIVGDSNTILKTTDGGENWVKLAPNGLDFNTFSHQIVDVDFVDENIGFVTILNDNMGVYKTTNGGLNWVASNNLSGNMCYKSRIFVNSEDDFFVGGAGCFQSAQIDRYQDPNWSNATVNYETFDTEDYITDFDFNNGVGLATVNNSYFLRTTDAGATWDTINSTLEVSARLTSVMFITADSVYAGYSDVGSGFGLLISLDAGLTWAMDMNSATFFYPDFNALKQSNSGAIYTGGAVSWGDEGVMFKSEDGGLLWDARSVDQPINGISSYGSDLTFAVGDSGYVIVNQLFGSLGLEDEEEFNTITIHPNPSSGAFNLELHQKYNEVEVIINDLLGQKVAERTYTNTSVINDVLDLPAGTYFINIRTNSFEVQTIKFIKN